MNAQEAGSPSDCCSVVTKAIEAAGRVKPGSTRQDIEKEFGHDGGLFTMREAAYVYKLCPYVKIRVVFALDPAGNGFEERPKDVVKSVSTPYLEYPHAD